MRILFVLYQYYPIPDAIGNCVRILRENLSALGVGSDVFSFRWNKQLEDKQTDAFGTIYLGDTWMRLARIQRDSDGRISKKPLPLARAAAVRAFAILCEGIRSKEVAMPAAACRKLGRKLQALCKENEYDWVISCGSPFCMHRMNVRYTPTPCRIGLYYFDPFYAHTYFSPRRTEKRLRMELDVANKADRIFFAPEHHEDVNAQSYGAAFSKVTFLPYPNLIIADPPADALPSPVSFAADRINCLFLGTFYDDIREPDALLLLFEKMHAMEPRLRLYLIGNKFGQRIHTTIQRYADLLGDSLVCEKAIPAYTVPQTMQACDILINLENTVRNQMPSKLFDYIASGKPILNICGTSMDNTFPFVARYPIGLNSAMTEAPLDILAEKAVAFCLTNQSARVTKASILERFYEESSPRVAARFLKSLQSPEAGNTISPHLTIPNG